MNKPEYIRGKIVDIRKERPLANTKEGSDLYEKILGEISKAVIGKDEIKEALMLALVRNSEELTGRQKREAIDYWQRELKKEQSRSGNS
tara:strand:- start:1534 stop:1800 length:267 start_codon:yes stop_codon:yes gene_type:complete